MLRGRVSITPAGEEPVPGHFGPGVQVVDEEEAVEACSSCLGSSRQFLPARLFQLQLVAEAPDAHELHVHPHGCADEPPAECPGSALGLRVARKRSVGLK